jgi:hypothetical protein
VGSIDEEGGLDEGDAERRVGGPRVAAAEVPAELPKE